MKKDRGDIIQQKSIGFKRSHLDFLNKYSNLNIHKICRAAVEYQMEQLGESFQEEE